MTFNLISNLSFHKLYSQATIKRINVIEGKNKVMDTYISKLGNYAIELVTSLGTYSLFAAKTIKKMISPPVSFTLLLKQLDFVGTKSFAICVVAGAMIGGIFGLQLGEVFGLFGVESLIGATAGFALTRELAPIVTAFLVTARAGSAMTAEIGTMRVNEQIDAMQVMSINPYGYLTSPRVLATTIIVPILSTIFVLSGLLCAMFISSILYGVEFNAAVSRLRWLVGLDDLLVGIEKSALFGFLLSSVCCYQGFHAKGGAKGVGIATTKAVVISYVMILLIDFLATYIQFKTGNVGLFDQ